MNITKKLFLALITLFTGNLLQTMDKEEKVTKNTILKHWCNKSLTSEMVEKYVRARLDFRISHWKNELKKWQIKWNINFDKEVIINSLSEECHQELKEIPFYIFYSKDNDKFLEHLKTNHLKKVYLFSGKNDENHCKEINYAINQGATGFTFKKEMGLKYPSLIKEESASLYFFYMVIEHELTHVEQTFETEALTEYYKRLKNKSLTANIMFHAFLNAPTTITPHAYEIYDYLQQNNHKSPHFSLVEWLNIIKKSEGEADKRALQFFECPILGYVSYKKLHNFNEMSKEEHHSEKCYVDLGYYPHRKRFQIIIERLIKEGYLNIKTPCIYTEKPQIPEKLISLQPPVFFNIKYIDDMGLNFMELRSKL